MRVIGAYVALKQIESERAEKYLGSSGITIDLSISKHSIDNVFWTNTMFECPKTGDKVFVKPQAVAQAFGSFASEKSQGEGYQNENGETIRFFNSEDIYLRITPSGEYVPKDGTCIVEKIKKPKIESSFILPEHYDKEEYEDRFLVRYVGKPLKKNRVTKTNASTVIEMTQIVPRVGSTIVTNYAGGLPLFSGMNIKLDKEYFVADFDSIMGEVFSDGSVFPLGDRVLVHHEREMVSSGIHLLNGKQSRSKLGKVVAHGPDCKLVKNGDYVWFGKTTNWSNYKKDSSDLDVIMLEQEIFFIENRQDNEI
jgi:chaperonin GroES